ncbi:unnamed protein product [Soboliphyme baturini]|uniref:tRNA-dihydrouridine(47) synthase [NAD(P)(+)] n=1 Tax=Soboliphyme baturini TaxID=241478 RepID=A0A183IML6_9BILA|nr:unnamed protein product [Soboliphyme baturini]
MASFGVCEIKKEFVVRRVVEENEANNEETADDEGGANGAHKKRAGGQNKKRPRVSRVPYGEKLCPSLLHSVKCPLKTCKYLHDVKHKPADLDGRCPSFEAFGRCRFGLACRFATQHTDDLLHNVVASLPSTNHLSKSVQQQLRKRTYRFGGAGEHGDSNGLGSDYSGTVCLCAQQRTFDKHSLYDNWDHKLLLAPLTTLGNLPFRRLCVDYGAEITCSEMVLAEELLKGHQSEWALIRRHESEKYFGVQLCGANADVMAKTAQLLMDQAQVDFVDLNIGCPIDLVCQRGMGCALMGRTSRLRQIVERVATVLNKDDHYVPLTAKLRTGTHCGIQKSVNTAHLLIPQLRDWGVNVISVHGRSRDQRFTKLADWQYIGQCARIAEPCPFYGFGDTLSFSDYLEKMEYIGVGGVGIARGALIKPWIFTEIQEKRHWDISASERLDMLKKYVWYGLQHWGSDQQGVDLTRRFLLEMLSFMYRYVPVGLLQHVPQRINERPPLYFGRNDLETLMASSRSSDWVKITEMLLGPVADDFLFLPKHKANSY